MKFYLASRYSDRYALRHHAAQLLQLGHQVMSRWIYTDYPPGEGPANAPPEEREQCSMMDIADLLGSDAFVGFNCEGKGRGGRHAEFGYALCHCATVIWIGKPEHIFHYSRKVKRFDAWSDFVDWLTGDYTSRER